MVSMRPRTPVRRLHEMRMVGVGSTRGRAEAALAVLLATVMVVVGAGAVWVLSTAPVHQNAAAVPSTADDAPSVPYAGPAEESGRLARALAAGDNLPGVSVAVAVNGEIVWAEGFGWADVEGRTTLTPLTRFRLGALSKPLTAVAAALLHDRGRLDLDAPIQRYVRAYPPKQWTVTTRQLLGDIAGVHRIRGDNNDAMPVSHCESLGEAVALLADDPLLFEPGTQHRYSIWGWILVSAVVEGAAGESFSRFMAHQVFEPLAMTRTVVAETAGLDSAHPFYAPRAMLRPQLGVEEAKRPDYSCLAGAGAFLSTPSDLVRLGSAMLKPGLLKADTIAAFQTPARLPSGASTTYALGWTVSKVQLGGEPARMVSHRGSPSGGTVSLLTFPDLGLAVAVAANVTEARGLHSFALQVAESFVRSRNRQPLPPRSRLEAQSLIPGAESQPVDGSTPAH
ncbi:Penicillin-binding protein E [Luteitalea pratensis]|uniref:Penicillin-binding protein E n=1 Tax=Luteitalea pratensis TaxID=1855912 RepID=A0A143PTH1_LUTPR|nr:Penicillin-binding protein E [Luteitalea pratensis]